MICNKHLYDKDNEDVDDYDDDHDDDVNDDTQQLAGQHHPPQRVPRVPQRGEASWAHRSFH